MRVVELKNEHLLISDRSLTNFYHCEKAVNKLYTNVNNMGTCSMYMRDIYHKSSQKNSALVNVIHEAHCGVTVEGRHEGECSHGPY